MLGNAADIFPRFHKGGRPFAITMRRYPFGSFVNTRPSTPRDEQPGLNRSKNAFPQLSHARPDRDRARDVL